MQERLASRGAQPDNPVRLPGPRPWTACASILLSCCWRPRASSHLPGWKRPREDGWRGPSLCSPIPPARCCWWPTRSAWRWTWRCSLLPAAARPRLIGWHASAAAWARTRPRRSMRCAGTQFRLLRVEAAGEEIARLRDLATGDVLPVLDDSIGAEAVGVALIGRLTPVGDGQYVFASGATPLDEAGLTVAAGFVRPGGRGLLNPQTPDPCTTLALVRASVRSPGRIRYARRYSPDGYEDGRSSLRAPAAKLLELPRRGANHPALAHPRRQRRGPPGRSARHTSRFVAGADAGAQDKNAGPRGPDLLKQAVKLGH